MIYAAYPVPIQVGLRDHLEDLDEKLVELRRITLLIKVDEKTRRNGSKEV